MLKSDQHIIFTRLQFAHFVLILSCLSHRLIDFYMISGICLSKELPSSCLPHIYCLNGMLFVVLIGMSFVVESCLFWGFYWLSDSLFLLLYLISYWPFKKEFLLNVVVYLDLLLASFRLETLSRLILLKFPVTAILLLNIKLFLFLILHCDDKLLLSLSVIHTFWCLFIIFA